MRKLLLLFLVFSIISVNQGSVFFYKCSGKCRLCNPANSFTLCGDELTTKTEKSDQLTSLTSLTKAEKADPIPKAEKADPIPKTDSDGYKTDESILDFLRRGEHLLKPENPQDRWEKLTPLRWKKILDAFKRTDCFGLHSP